MQSILKCCVVGVLTGFVFWSKAPFSAVPSVQKKWGKPLMMLGALNVIHRTMQRTESLENTDAGVKYLSWLEILRCLTDPVRKVISIGVCLKLHWSRNLYLQNFLGFKRTLPLQCFFTSSSTFTAADKRTTT